MPLTLIQPAFSVGEISPALFGRVDLKQYSLGCSTLRNMFVNYRGGASSRAGTKFIGRCKQTADQPAPRDITFQFSLTQSYALEFGHQYMRVKSNGGYVTESEVDIQGISNGNPCVVSAVAHGLVNGDWVFLSDIEGMTELNNQIFIVDNATTDTFTLIDMFDEPVNSVSYDVYTSGGTLARIFTLITPYDGSDIRALKTSQSADVMTIVHNDYPPYDLVRLAPNNWSLVEVTFGTSISRPLTMSAAATVTTTTTPTQYQYVVTAIDLETGEESIASPIASVTNSVNIASSQGSIDLGWSAVDGAGSYNIYKAPEAFNSEVPVGSLFGYIGTALGLTFVDGNIVADFSTTPPLHRNPFSPEQVISVTMDTVGTGYTSAPTVTINTLTGSGAVLTPVVISTEVQAIIVDNPGANYASSDTISISGGGGADATATLNVGPQTGTYPAVVAYFQQRQVYANTINNPDTYFMSQPGAFDNMDVSQIPIDSDAITGTPWAQQVNGIQALVPMPGGLVVFTGLGAWQLSGGGPATPITPVNQFAQPQAYNGCHAEADPITINFDILYVQAKGSAVRDLAYDFYKNIYTGDDLTVLSSHLFQGYDIVQWAWCEEPNKIIWIIRSDGAILSLTFLKDQTSSVIGWARHYTNGLYVSVCSVSEPPVDSLYVIVKRFINNKWLYYSERMDNRLWSNDVESCWCVDTGLSLAQPTPEATIQASAYKGDARIGSVSVVDGGSGYTDPTFVITDLTGSGAEITATLNSGVIESITVTSSGSNYSAPSIQVIDPDGSGAVLAPIITNPVSIVADAAVFSSGNIGDVIRAGGGIGTITSFVSPTEVEIDLTRQISLVFQEDPNQRPVPVSAGDWSMTTPQSVIRGALHLKGETIVALGDGSVIEDIEVDNTGQFELPVAVSDLKAGLRFTSQVQSLYANTSSMNIQGKEKNIPTVTIRLEASRGVEVGSNQVDASTQPYQTAPPWTLGADGTGMEELRERGNGINAGTAIPLYTGDYKVNIRPDWNTKGQVAAQNRYPVPMNVLALIPEVSVGDDND